MVVDVDGLLRIGVNTFAYAGHGEIRERVMLERFRDPETVRRLNVETLEMLAFRGGGAAHPHRWQRGGDDPRPLRHREHPLPGAPALDDDLHRRSHPLT
ncbi:MAG: hypothetical protein OXG44_07335 [Gammaproteobacteria bacterium]|nr:hypothetical protein [Gammaproteobacteria bacterium]